MKKFLLLVCALMLSSYAGAANADIMNTTPLPHARHDFINVANDSGVKYNLDGAYYGGPNNTYYIKADGGGLNELHMTTDVTNYNNGTVSSVNTSTGSVSGSLYFTNTGGRGFDNDIILMASVKGPISDDFSLNIKSYGYEWTLPAAGNYNPNAPTDYKYITGINETFTKSDFLYGPHVYKPGPNSGGSIDYWYLPLYNGQNTADASTAEYLMFIDLYAGNLYPTKFPGVSLVDNGAVKVDFSISGLYNTTAAFNGYGWCIASNQGEGITWTNDVASSSYKITSTAAAPVPIPPAVFLFGSGLSGLFFLKRRRLAA